MSLRETPSQTVGPFFAIGLEPCAASEGVALTGRVLDGEGQPVPDAVVETWAPFGRSLTDTDGRYALTVAPGPYATLRVFARGLLNHVTTRAYFEAGAMPDDVPEDRRATLLVDGGKFDIQLQGDHETVFFAI